MFYYILALAWLFTAGLWYSNYDRWGDRWALIVAMLNLSVAFLFLSLGILKTQ